MALNSNIFPEFLLLTCCFKTTSVHDTLTLLLSLYRVSLNIVGKVIILIISRKEIGIIGKYRVFSQTGKGRAHVSWYEPFNTVSDITKYKLIILWDGWIWMEDEFPPKKLSGHRTC